MGATVCSSTLMRCLVAVACHAFKGLFKTMIHIKITTIMKTISISPPSVPNCHAGGLLFCFTHSLGHHVLNFSAGSSGNLFDLINGSFSKLLYLGAQAGFARLL